MSAFINLESLWLRNSSEALQLKRIQRNVSGEPDVILNRTIKLGWGVGGNAVYKKLNARKFISNVVFGMFLFVHFNTIILVLRNSKQNTKSLNSVVLNRERHNIYIPHWIENIAADYHWQAEISTIIIRGYILSYHLHRNCRYRNILQII